MWIPPPTAPQAPSIAEVVVVAPRSEQPVTTSFAKHTVISAEDLARTGERSLPRAIAAAAGVWVQESNLGGGAPVIRGLLGNQVLILVDGVRLNDATTRLGPNQSLNTLDPQIVERVEIVRGPSSVLYGSDAIGGVVLIWTKRSRAGSTGAAGALTSLYDSATDGGRISGEIAFADEHVGALGILTFDRWHDLETAEGDAGPTGYRTSAGFASADLFIDTDRTLRLTAMVHRDVDVPRTFSVVPGFGQSVAPFEKYDFALQEREWTVATFDDREPGLLADSLQVRVSARRSREQRMSRRTGASLTTFSETRVDTVGVAADWRRDLSGARITFGFDFDTDDVDSFARRTGTTSAPLPGDFAPNARYTGFGTFVQSELLDLAPYAVTLGVRYSAYDFAFDDPEGARVRGEFDAVTASLEASAVLSNTSSLTATLAQGFQAPNLEDLANDGDFAGGTELANPDLEPAESLSAELAFDVLADTWSATTAIFYTRIDDVLGRTLLDAGDPLIAGDELYLRANDGRLDLYGAEVRADAALVAPGSPWTLFGLASFVRGRQQDDTGTVEGRRIPPLNGRVGLSWLRPADPVPARLTDARVSLVWADDQSRLHPDDASDPRIDPSGTPGWAVWVLEAGGQLSSGVRWSAALMNPFDTAYRVHGSGIDGPGRALVLGLRGSF